MRLRASAATASPPSRPNLRLLRRFLRILACLPWYRLIARPILFRLDPETAQKAAEATLRARPLWHLHRIATAPSAPPPQPALGGVRAPNPVGLAAGFDKRCVYLDALPDLGFGYLVAGTITREPRPGNPRPRLARRPAEESLVNAMGFPSDGVEACAERLARCERRVPVVASVAAFGDEDTLFCVQRLDAHVDGFELNVSSPNTAGVWEYQDAEALQRLLTLLQSRTKPLFVKMPPYQDETGREKAHALLRACLEAGAQGVTVANALPVLEPRVTTGTGGLSGRALLENTLVMTADARREVGGDLAVNACGGIATPADARRAIDAGADSVQLYTALVYRGPGVVNQIVAGLARSHRA